MSRSHRFSSDPSPANRADFLLGLGKALQERIRRGLASEDAFMETEVAPAYCQLALALIEASDRVKLQAMVEDWSPERIAWELGLASCPARTGQDVAPIT